MSNSKKSVAMDRVAAELVETNNEWMALNEEVRAKGKRIKNQYLIDLAGQLDEMREKFANLACLGSPEAWRMIAANNHFIGLKDASPEELAIEIIRSTIDIPALVEALVDALHKRDQSG